MEEPRNFDAHQLQKTFLNENKKFLDAIRKKLPLEEILQQYDKVTSLFETIKKAHRHTSIHH